MNCHAAVSDSLLSICSSCFNILLCFCVTNKNSHNKNVKHFLQLEFSYFHLNLGAFLSLRNKKLLALSAATFTHWKNMHLNNQTAIWSHLEISVNVEFEAVIQCNMLH